MSWPAKASLSVDSGGRPTGLSLPAGTLPMFGRTLGSILCGVLADSTGAGGLQSSEGVSVQTASSNVAFTANITSGSAAFTVGAITAPGVLYVGQKVTGSGIPANTYIATLSTQVSGTLATWPTGAAALATATTTGAALVATYLYTPGAVGRERGGGVAWITQLCLLSNGRLILNHNGGVASDTSAGCLSRLDHEISLRPDLMFLQMGMTNDINGGVALATSKANMITAIGRCRSAGILPVLVTVYPSNTAGVKVAGRAWNEWLKSYGQTNGIPVLDSTSVLTNPANTSGDWIAAYTSDGTHATSLGAQVDAQSKLAQLITYGIVPAVGLGSSFNRLASFQLGNGINSPSNLVKDPLFNLGATAGVAFSWSVGGTGSTVPTINAAPGSGVIGSAQLLTLATGDKPTYAQDITITGTDGHRYMVAGLFRTSGCQAGGITYTICDLNTFGSPAQHNIVGQNFVGVDFTNWTPFYIEIAPQAGATLLRLTLLSLPVNSLAACTFEFAMVRAVDLDAL